MKDQWSSPIWAGSVRVALGYPSDGWVLLSLTSDVFNQSVEVNCSDVFCPFPNTEAWLHRIKDGELPAQLLVNEEGNFKSLLACSIPGDPKSFSFFISTDPNWSGDVLDDKYLVFKCRTNRIEFVRNFGREVSRWIKEDWAPLLYGGRYDEEDEEEYRTAAYLTKLDFSTLATGDT